MSVHYAVKKAVVHKSNDGATHNEVRTYIHSQGKKTTTLGDVIADKDFVAEAQAEIDYAEERSKNERLARYQELRDLCVQVFKTLNRPTIFELAKPIIADMAKGGPDYETLADNLRWALCSSEAYVNAVAFITGGDPRYIEVPRQVLQGLNERLR